MTLETEYQKKLADESDINVRYYAVRARNLAEEMTLTQGDWFVDGEDMRLTGWALEFYEQHCAANVLEQDRDEMGRWAIERVALHEYDAIFEKAADGGGPHSLGVIETMIAATALRHFSKWLFEQLEPEAKAA